MEEIRQFLITQCGDPAKNSFEPPTDFDGLAELLHEFQNQAAWHLDKDAMAELIYGQTIETQIKKRQDEWIAFQGEQNRFNAANSALNGLVAGAGYLPSDDCISYGFHQKAVILADALLAELNKANQ